MGVRAPGSLSSCLVQSQAVPGTYHDRCIHMRQRTVSQPFGSCPYNTSGNFSRMSKHDMVLVVRSVRSALPPGAYGLARQSIEYQVIKKQPMVATSHFGDAALFVTLR